MNSAPPPTPAWDQEATLAEARAQVRIRVEEQAAARGVDAHWLARAADPGADLATIEALDDGVVIGSDTMLWRWSPAAVVSLSESLQARRGLLVFIEPTAGLGVRRAAQLLGRRYRRDLPAELRSTGLIVTTQVRLRHGLIGTYVRGEARHFDHES